MANRHSASFKFDSLASIILLAAFFVGLFLLLKGVFTLLSIIWVAIGLLAATLLIDRYVVINYVKWLWSTLLTKPLYGIAAIVFTMVGYMVVVPFLFAKAILKKKVKSMAKDFEQQMGDFSQPKDEFVDYEEISSKPKKEEPLELPRLDKQPRHEPKGNDYDQYFK